MRPANPDAAPTTTSATPFNAIEPMEPRTLLSAAPMLRAAWREADAVLFARPMTAPTAGVHAELDSFRRTLLGSSFSQRAREAAERPVMAFGTPDLLGTYTPRDDRATVVRTAIVQAVGGVVAVRVDAQREEHAGACEKDDAQQGESRHHFTTQSAYTDVYETDAPDMGRGFGTGEFRPVVRRMYYQQPVGAITDVPPGGDRDGGFRPRGMPNRPAPGGPVNLPRPEPTPAPGGDDGEIVPPTTSAGVDVTATAASTPLASTNAAVIVRGSANRDLSISRISATSRDVFDGASGTDTLAAGSIGATASATRVVASAARIASSALARSPIPFDGGNSAGRTTVSLPGTAAEIASAVLAPAASVVGPTVVSFAKVGPRRVFDIVQFGSPFALTADSVATFVEESASIPTAMLASVTGTRASQPRQRQVAWLITATVIAADITLLTYAHRRHKKVVAARSIRGARVAV